MSAYVSIAMPQHRDRDDIQYWHIPMPTVRLPSPMQSLVFEEPASRLCPTAPIDTALLARLYTWQQQNQESVIEFQSTSADSSSDVSSDLSTDEIKVENGSNDGEFQGHANGLQHRHPEQPENKEMGVGHLSTSSGSTIAIDMAESSWSSSANASDLFGIVSPRGVENYSGQERNGMNHEREQMEPHSGDSESSVVHSKNSKPHSPKNPKWGSLLASLKRLVTLRLSQKGKKRENGEGGVRVESVKEPNLPLNCCMAYFLKKKRSQKSSSENRPPDQEVGDREWQAAGGASQVLVGDVNAIHAQDLCDLDDRSSSWFSGSGNDPSCTASAPTVFTLPQDDEASRPASGQVHSR